MPIFATWLVTGMTPIQVIIGGFTGTGFAHLTSGSLDTAASLGTPLTVPQVNAGGTDIAWVSLSTSAGLVAVPLTSGSLQAANGQRIWCVGAVTVLAPVVVVGGRWGIKDDNTAPGALSITIPNAGGTIEDPNSSGTFTTNPIVLTTQGFSATWEANPTATRWGLTG